MKKLALIALITMTSFQAFAEQDTVPGWVKRLPQLCQLETDYSSRLFETQSFDVLQMPGLNADLLGMVNYHLKTNHYNETQKSLTLEQIKHLFSEEGDYSYDELNVILLKHRGTGKQYVYVQSFPGDNEYGVYFDAKTRKPIAFNGDGSITLETNHGAVDCYKLIH